MTNNIAPSNICIPFKN